jgi:hypothetical protein
MFRLINRTTLVFFGFFLVACAGMALYDVIFVWPQQHCESDGAWWDSKDHECLTPIPIWRLTGRTMTAPAHGSAPARSLQAPAPMAAPVKK